MAPGWPTQATRSRKAACRTWISTSIRRARIVRNAPCNGAGRIKPANLRGRQDMAPHIDGPLYYETTGKRGPVMAFVHPNPMDQSCWIFQLAQMSTWYRCIAIDLPGYGRSPKARAGLTMADVAQACWEAIDDA